MQGSILYPKKRTNIHLPFQLTYKYNYLRLLNSDRAEELRLDARDELLELLEERDERESLEELEERREGVGREDCLGAL